MENVPFTRCTHLPAAVRAVRREMAAHGVVAVPTETFYGLAVRPDDPLAVCRVFALKGRPEDRALPVVAASLDQLAPLVTVSETWRLRLNAVWPAPLTVVLPAKMGLAAGTATLAVRVPDHTLLRALLASVGPLTATSANRFGSPALASPRKVTEALGEGLALLLDGGDARGGVPSTLVDLASATPRVLRRGAWEPPAEWGVGPA